MVTRARSSLIRVSLLSAWFSIQGLVYSECLASEPETARSARLSPREPGAVATIAMGKFRQVLVIRLKQGDDLLNGLQKAVAQAGVKNGVFMGAFGSLTSYHVHVVNNTSFPPKNIYTKGKGPYDILSVTGAVIDGRLHPHLSLSDSKRALGGHLEEGSVVFTFAVITLGVFEDGISLDKFDDWNWQ